MRVGARIARTARRFRREETGFTLIELMSAMIVTGLGTVALITTLDSSRQLITFSEAKESAVAIGERELERIQSHAYAEIALAGTPTACADAPTPCDALDPGYYVTGGHYRWDQRPWTQRCDSSGAPADKCEALVVDTSAPGSVSHTAEQEDIQGPNGVRLRVQIQRFVTWVDDDCTKVNPPPDPTEVCDGVNPDYKRVTVAVRIIKALGGNGEGLVNGGPGRPMIFSTAVRPPPLEEALQ